MPLKPFLTIGMILAYIYPGAYKLGYRISAFLTVLKTKVARKVPFGSTFFEGMDHFGDLFPRWYKEKEGQLCGLQNLVSVVIWQYGRFAHFFLIRKYVSYFSRS